MKNLQFLFPGISDTPDCSGFLPSVPCKRLPLPDVCCLFPSAPVLAYLYLQVHHEVRSYRSPPTPHKKYHFPFPRASDRSRSSPLFLYPCCFLHAAILHLHTSLQKYGYFQALLSGRLFPDCRFSVLRSGHIPNNSAPQKKLLHLLPVFHVNPLRTQ